MRRQPLILFVLLLAISGWMLWARGPATPPIAAIVPAAQTQTSPPATPTITPTPLPPMPTPAVTVAVEADWQTYTSPTWGITFRYPPGWAVYESPDYISISAVGESGGEIFILMEDYLLSAQGSLREWVTLENVAIGSQGRGPLTPYYVMPIPTNLLPGDVEQGVFSTNHGRVTPTEAVWLAWNGFVFRVASNYHRPIDTANLFAIIVTLKFDPAMEEVLRRSNRWSGDEAALRQQYEEVTAMLAAQCDYTCQMQENYNMRMLALDEARQLPAHQRPFVDIISPILIGSDWLTYTHPTLGISLRYSPDWSVEDPFTTNKLDESSAVQTKIILRTTDEREVLTIELMPYTVSDDVPLHNWEAIHDQLNRAQHPADQFRYRLIVPIRADFIPQQVEDIVHTRQQAADYQVEDFFMSKDGVVFRVMNSDRSLQQQTAAVLSTIKFDTAQLAKLRAQGIFAGDERAMTAALVGEWAKPTTPTPTVNPHATPTPFSTITPRPITTNVPIPTVRATVTPSAFESPLINGQQRYQGETIYDSLSPFELWFAPALWQLAADEDGRHYLVHQTFNGCEIDLRRAPLEGVSWLAPVDLAGQHWRTIAYSRNNADVIGYYLNLDNGTYMYSLILSERLPDVYDPNQKSQCQLDAEAVFDTFSQVGVTLTATPDATAQMPTVTPSPISTSAASQVPPRTSTPVP